LRKCHITRRILHRADVDCETESWFRFGLSSVIAPSRSEGKCSMIPRRTSSENTQPFRGGGLDVMGRLSHPERHQQRCRLVGHVASRQPGASSGDGHPRVAAALARSRWCGNRTRIRSQAPIEVTQSAPEPRADTLCPPQGPHRLEIMIPPPSPRMTASCLDRIRASGVGRSCATPAKPGGPRLGFGATQLIARRMRNSDRGRTVRHVRMCHR